MTTHPSTETAGIAVATPWGEGTLTFNSQLRELFDVMPPALQQWFIGGLEQLITKILEGEPARTLRVESNDGTVFEIGESDSDAAKRWTGKLSMDLRRMLSCTETALHYNARLVGIVRAADSGNPLAQFVVDKIFEDAAAEAS